MVITCALTGATSGPLQYEYEFGVVFFIGMKREEILNVIKDFRLTKSDLMLIFFFNFIQECWPKGQKELANLLGISERTINRSVNNLEKYGYIKMRKVYKTNKKLIRN